MVLFQGVSEMCGIIAYKGNKDASAVLVEGLKNLEYRGYDSWGIATRHSSLLSIAKKVGKISDAPLLKPDGSHEGIGHTRWSTHGTVSEANAHPQVDCSGRIAVVHNGIIENYQQLKKQLQNHAFASETDTELIPHAIEERMDAGSSFEDAAREVAALLKGRSSFAAISKDSENIVAARCGTPLIVGIGKDEHFIASDVTAFLRHTNRVMYLNDGEFLVLNATPKFVSIATGKEVEKRVVELDWKPEAISKDGFDHFLMKEIMEQKESLWRAINQDEATISAVANDINKAFGSFLIGCGTAGKVCMAGEYLFSKVARKHINAYVASEFPNYASYLTNKSLVIAVSQSGETADVLEALEAAKQKGARIISLLNVFGSSMTQLSDAYFMVNAGAERAVVSTKATTAQLAVMTLLAYATAGKLQDGKLLLMDTASAVNDMLNPRYEEHIKNLAQLLKTRDTMFIIGRALNYPIALEAAIKLQETAYVHAQGFAGGELKHGPLALIEKGTPCIALIANDESKDEMISNAMEIKTRGGFIIGIAPENNEVFDFWIKVPDAGNASPIVNIIPVQVLAYHLALLRGCDPDYPRNLAKSVVVK
jgi:glutamine---fructose-6-phosphate transaminase (isomerizing)